MNIACISCVHLVFGTRYIRFISCEELINFFSLRLHLFTLLKKNQLALIFEKSSNATQIM